MSWDLLKKLILAYITTFRSGNTYQVEEKETSFTLSWIKYKIERLVEYSGIISKIMPTDRID